VVGTVSGPVRMRGDIFAAVRRRRGRVHPAGHPASRAPRRGRCGGGSGGALAAGQGSAWASLGRGSSSSVCGLTQWPVRRRWCAALGGRPRRLPSCCCRARRRRGGGGGAGGGVGVPRSRLVSVGVRVDVVAPRSGGGVLCSGVVFVCRRLRHHTLRRIPSLLCRQRRGVGWVDVLLDALGVGWKAPSALWDGCPGTMTGVSQHWCLRHFDRCSSTLMLYRASPSAPTCGANRAS